MSNDTTTVEKQYYSTIYLLLAHLCLLSATNHPSCNKKNSILYDIIMFLWDRNLISTVVKIYKIKTLELFGITCCSGKNCNEITPTNIVFIVFYLHSLCKNIFFHSGYVTTHPSTISGAALTESCSLHFTLSKP